MHAADKANPLPRFTRSYHWWPVGAMRGKGIGVRRELGLLAVLVVLLMGIIDGLASTDAAAIATPAFTQQWGAGEAITPNFWGPLANARAGQQEPYQQAPGGLRTVQYFDKGRMELTNGTLTNGLLATELVTGRIQTGDNSFRPQPPPAIPIAGDANNSAPTYAGLAAQGAALLMQTTSTPGGLVRATINPDGSVTTTNATVPDPALTIGAYDDTTRHNIARAFVEYRNKAGLSAIGLAISEPFRANVKVGGTPKDVMVQIFERRVLTYTASNPAAFQVEMGNIGQHYFQWRYAAASHTDDGNDTTAGARQRQPPRLRRRKA